MKNHMLQYLLDNWIALLALVISIPSCFLAIKSYFRSIPKLKIKNGRKNWLIGFFDDSSIPHQIAISRLTIENTSTTDISISTIYLDINGVSFPATHPKYKDAHNDSGISISTDPSLRHGFTLNLTSENILNNLRIQSNGNISGFVVFEEIPIITEIISGKIVIEAPNKTYQYDITFEPMPDGYFTVLRPLSKKPRK